MKCRDLENTHVRHNDLLRSEVCYTVVTKYVQLRQQIREEHPCQVLSNSKRYDHINIERDYPQTFGVANTINIMKCGPRLFESIIYHRQSPFSVVLGCIPREEAFSWWGDIRMPNIGKDGNCAIWGVLNNSGSQLIRRAFKTKCYVGSF